MSELATSRCTSYSLIHSFYHSLIKLNDPHIIPADEIEVIVPEYPQIDVFGSQNVYFVASANNINDRCGCRRIGAEQHPVVAGYARLHPLRQVGENQQQQQVDKYDPSLPHVCFLVSD